jgi:BNR repeat-like domain
MTVSKDNGIHWSLPVETAFTDNDSKFHFGKLPDGRFYYVGIPDTLHHYARTPLVLAVSNDGVFFNQQYIVADETYMRKEEGLWKGGQYGYPHTMIYNGYMYIIISRQKESIEIIRFKISQLKN